VNSRTPLSLASKLTILGLLVAAAGISTLFLTNSVAVPPIPIGPILLVLAAVLVAFGPWRWTPAIGVALSLTILVGGIISGIVDHLSNPAQVGGFIGSWLNVLGLITAIIAGTLTTVQSYQTRTSVTSR
jgi:hypothetical protein